MPNPVPVGPIRHDYDPAVPLVSVIVPTYQHAPFIAQCLDGILGQETTFPFEILVGEDESTDGTREICQRYAAAHPERIRLFLRSRKDVMYFLGKPTGRANVLDLLQEAKGEYLAACEGDDRWIDPLKLEKQMAAMKAAPDAAGCFTDAWNDRNGDRTTYMDGTYASKPKQEHVNERDIVLGQGVPWCTVLFRRNALVPLPEQLLRSPVGDTILLTHAAGRGGLLYLPGHTAVRHMHPGGIHSLSSQLHQIKVKEATWPLLDEMTEGRYHEELSAKLARMHEREWDHALAEGDRKTLRHLWTHASGLRYGSQGKGLHRLFGRISAQAPAVGRLMLRLYRPMAKG